MRFSGLFKFAIFSIFCVFLLPSCVYSSITASNLMAVCKSKPTEEQFSFRDSCSTDFTAKCGDPKVIPTLLKRTRIIGGNKARPHSWPWQTSLQYKSSADWKHLCGASIISRCYVITAAHCVEDYARRPRRLKIIAGIHDLKTEIGSVHEVSKVFLYPLYQGALTQWDHDVAILKVNPPFKFSRNISKICVPLDSPNNRTTAAATGWGTTSDGGSLSDALRQVALPVVPWNECATIYPHAINENKLCAGYLKTGGRDTCQGDSGGPLVTRVEKRYWLSGITSVGSNCALPNKPGIYTNVFMYRRWIIRYLTDKNECLKSATNQCQQVCVNTPGSYKCECCDGYSLTEGRFCSIECGKPEKKIPSLPTNDQLALADSLSFPWMLSVRTTYDLSSHRCAGVLIASKWVLTAAICVIDQHGKLIQQNKVRVISSPQITNKNGQGGSEAYYDDDDGYKENELKQEFEVEKIILHHQFNSRVYNLGMNYGVALLKLKTRVTYYSYVKPVCLPLNRISNDQLCMSTGWREAKGPLTKKQVLTSNKLKCTTESYQRLTDRQFCAGRNHQWLRTCNQDAGSPLITYIDNRAVAVGIATGKCTPARGKNVYLDLSYFKKWILEEIDGYSRA